MLRIQTLLSVLVFFYPWSPVSSSPVENVEPIAVPILAYHNVSPDPALDGDEYTIPLEQFEAQLDILQIYGYTTVSLQDYLDYSTGEALPPAKPVILTFDDGYQDMFTYVLPALESRGMLASFFIPTGKIGEDEISRQENTWSKSYTQGYKYKLLIWSEVQAIASAGMEIGSHSVNHERLNSSNAAFETEQSRLDLETRLEGQPISFFAYPYGIGGTINEVRNAVIDAGYSLALDYVNEGEVDPPPAEVGVSDPYNLPRRHILPGMGLDLNVLDPWSFFMRRLDPGFQVPNIYRTGLAVISDLDGHARERFVGGEQVEIAVPIHISYPAEVFDLSSSIVIPPGPAVQDMRSFNVGDSRMEIPSPVGVNQDQTYPFSWQIPISASVGEYVYEFCLNGSFINGPGVFKFSFCPEPSYLFNLVESPISITVKPDEVIFTDFKPLEVYFDLTNQGPASLRTYLSVSISPGLRVDEILSSPEWEPYRVGWYIKQKGGGTIPAVYELLEISLDRLPAGASTFKLVLTPEDGADADLWLRYRMVTNYDFASDNLLDPSRNDLRWPLYGEPDQQGWFAKVLDVTVVSKAIYLPLITR